MRINVVYLLPAVFSTVLTVFFALQTFARLSVVSNDTKGLEWLIPVAYKDQDRDPFPNVERHWVRSLIMMLFCALVATISFTGLFE